MKKRIRSSSYLNPEIFKGFLVANEDTGCQEWTRTMIRGYGCFPKHGKTHLAHRQAWEFAHGPIPQGLSVCHKCDNPKCCNPDHLFLGTHADNMRDKHSKGRARGPKHLVGVRHPQSKLTEEQVLEIRRTYRKRGGPLASGAALAKRFGVSDTTISAITNSQIWAHLE